MTLFQRFYSLLPFTGISRKTRRFLYSELGHMLEAGISTLKALNILSANHHVRSLRKALKDIENHIKEGGNLSSGLSRYPHLLPPMEVRLIETAEFAGSLPAAFNHLAEFLERLSRFWSKFLGGLIYPAFLVFFALVIIPLFRAFFVGDFEAALRGVGINLLQIGIVLYTFILIVRLIRQIPLLHFLMSSFLLNIPILARLLRKLAHARFADTLEIMYRIGVPVPEAISRSASACGNEVVARRIILRAVPIVKAGGTIRDALAATREFSPMALGMIEVGELSGKLDVSLRKYAENENQEVAVAFDALSRMVPVMIYMLIMLWLAYTILSGFTQYFNAINSAIQ